VKENLLERSLDCGALEAKFSNGQLERELGFGLIIYFSGEDPRRRRELFS
jgi:hypothetical protein